VDLESILLVAMTWKTDTITLVNSMITYWMEKEECCVRMEKGTEVQTFNWGHMISSNASSLIDISSNRMFL
jgi:hypothetical protein